MTVEPAKESACLLPVIPIYPEANRNEIVIDLVIKDSREARILKIIEEHLERKALLTIARRLA